MKLSPEEKKAVQDSRDHWVEDIVGPLKCGATISGKFYWSYDFSPVPCFAKHCALCVLVGLDEGSNIKCTECAYVKFYKFKCCDNRGHWARFDDNANLETAQEMADALNAILKSQGI